MKNKVIDDIKSNLIKISGIVQGVGFRPFIYRLAKEMGLKGEVINTSYGVLIAIEGQEYIINGFLDRILKELPPLAYIKEMKIHEGSLQGYHEFTIGESKLEENKFTLISPDVSICDDCLQELFNEKDRRFRYPFINCTNCGPRFTIIKDIPYDRPKTTMVDFELCPQCLQEYKNPGDRRFHAQPNACSECGPALSLKDNNWQDVIDKNQQDETDDFRIISLAVKLLKDGKILAIKGLGGYHLACDAKNNQAVQTLRSRKVREDKPFAIMAKNIKVISDQVNLNEKEEEILQNYKKPIVLLKKKPQYNLSLGIAPGNSYLGVMLPYTPLHQLLLNCDKELDILVMTSANKSSEPIVYKDSEAFDVLKDIADYFLIHNREIFRRVDDSVTRVWRDKEYILRRSRGYAPYPIVLDYKIDKEILACGGEQKNIFCMNQGQYFFMSHHIGDLENLETMESFEEGIADFKKLFNIQPQIITYDLHPEYLSTKYAQEIDLPKFPIQHHHAHVVSCMAEHGLQEDVLGVVFDGTGFGTDGRLWGGEFLVSNLSDFQRYAHLQYVPMPGGSKAIKEPWRMALAYLLQAFGEEYLLNNKLDFLSDISQTNVKLLIDVINKGINSPFTSSIGRLFDAVAAIINLRTYVNYEGQGAIELEQLAVEETSSENLNAKLEPYSWDMTEDKTINVLSVIREIVKNLQKGVSSRTIAYRFHLTIADIITRIALQVREKSGINKVCLSGGVFQNLLLLDQAFNQLTGHDFQVFVHSLVPTNDGGIALGQAIIAHERSAKKCV